MSVSPRALVLLTLLASGCDGRSTKEPSTRDPDASGGESEDADAALRADDASVAGDAASAEQEGDASTARDAGTSSVPPEPGWPLGMNDVTMLIPRHEHVDAAVLLRAADHGADGAPLVPRALYDRLDAPVCHRFSDGRPCAPGSSPVMFPEAYEHLHLVAVRFDLCDRKLPVRCPADADGSLRLVFQPALSSGFFFDASLHLFYAIPNADLSNAVSALRSLARIQAEPTRAPLKPSPALSVRHQAAYAEGLRAFVRERAREDRLLRVAINAQPAEYSAVRWILRALEREPGGGFKERQIAATETTQDVILSGGFEVTPGDQSAELAGVPLDKTFNAADAAQKKKMLEALLAVDNPLAHTLDSVTCAACHTSTALFAARSPGFDLKSLSGGYQSSYDVSIGAGFLPGTMRTLRMLGYQGTEPMIATRVTHETAQVLSELAERFP